MNGTTFKISNLLEGNIVQYCNTVNGSIREKPLSTLNEKFMGGSLEFLKSGTEISFARENKETSDALSSLHGIRGSYVSDALWRYQILTTIIQKKKSTTPAIQACKDLLVTQRDELSCIEPTRKLPSNHTIAKWMKRFELHGNTVESLVPRTMHRGKAGYQLQPVVERIIVDCIDKQYLTKKRLSMKHAYDHVITTVENHNLYHGTDYELPSRATVYRRLDDLMPYEEVKRRRGKEYADKKFRTVLHNLKLHYPLERVEIDNTPLDGFVLDDETLEPIKRPVLTLVIDCYTRMILGFAISIGGANLQSIFDALRMAILPKTWLRTKYPDIDNEWPCYGVGMHYVLDNGSEYFTKSLRQAIYELGGDVSFIPRRKAWLRGISERTQGTLNHDLAESLDGKSFISIVQRGDYKSIKEANLTLSQVEELITKWIVNIYQHTVHRSLGKKPIDAWNESLDAFVPRLPESIKQLDLTLSYRKTRTITHKGIELNRIPYNNTMLGELRRKIGDTFEATVRWTPSDLTKVYVEIPNSPEFLAVEAINADELAGLSLHEWKLIRRKRAKPNHEEMAKHRVAHEREAQKMAKSTSLQKRTQAARLRQEQKKAQQKQGTKLKAPKPVLKPEILISFGKEAE